MSAFRASDGPARVGDESGEREWATVRRWGMRERGRMVLRVGSPLLVGELAENGSSGENGGDGGSDGEDNWRGEMGRLRGKGGGVADDRSGDEKPDEVGEIDGEEGPGEGWSVGATDVEADGPYELVRLGASSTSFSNDERKLGPAVVSPFGRALELAAPARDDSPAWFC